MVAMTTRVSITCRDETTQYSAENGTHVWFAAFIHWLSLFEISPFKSVNLMCKTLLVLNFSQPIAQLNKFLFDCNSFEINVILTPKSRILISQHLHKCTSILLIVPSKLTLKFCQYIYIYLLLFRTCNCYLFQLFANARVQLVSTIIILRHDQKNR